MQPQTVFDINERPDRQFFSKVFLALGKTLEAAQAALLELDKAVIASLIDVVMEKLTIPEQKALKGKLFTGEKNAAIIKADLQAAADRSVNRVDFEFLATQTELKISRNFWQKLFAELDEGKKQQILLMFDEWLGQHPEQEARLKKTLNGN